MAKRDLKGKVLKLRYGLTTRVSERGASATYLGWDEDEERQVVVRVPHVDLLDDDDFVARFLAPDHVPEGITGLADVLEIDAEGDLAYAVVAFVEGESLRERMKANDGRIAAEDMAPWLGSIGDALGALHERGIAHRSVTPKSILVTPDGGAVLTDVAVASALDATPTGPEILDAGEYAAPEARSTSIAPASDQFSLAATVATAVMGDGFLARQARKGLVGALVTRMPADAANAVFRALDPEPEGRYPDVGAFVTAFVGAVKDGCDSSMGEGTSTMMLGDVVAILESANGDEDANDDEDEDVPVAEAIGEADVPVAVAEVEREKHTEPERPKRRWGILVGGLLAVAIVCGIWFALQSVKTPEREAPPVVAERETPLEPDPEPETPAEPPPFSAELEIADGSVPALTKDASVSVTGRIVDGAGARVDVDGRRFEPGEDGAFVLDLPLQEGRNEFRVRVIDAHDRTGEPQALVIERDTKAPTVQLTSTPKSPTGETSVHLVGRMLDDHPREVRVGDVVAVVLEDRTFEADVLLPEEGENVLRVVGVDGVGLESEAQTVRIVRDTGDPVLKIEVPTEGRSVTTETIEVRGTVVDPHLAGLTVNEVAATLAEDGSWSASVQAAEGAVELVVVARDSLGHQTKQVRRVVRDSTGPGVTITAPGEVSSTKEATVTVRGRVQDPNPGLVTVHGTELTPDESGWFETKVALKPGKNEIRVVATDSAGNRSPEKILVVTLDQTAPGIDVGVVPAEVKADVETLSIAGTVSEDGCRVTVAGKEAVVTGRNFSADVVLATGKNSIEFVAEDRVGNRGTRTFEVLRKAAGPARGASFVENAEDGASVNGEVPEPLPMGLAAGDIVAGPATIMTPEKDRIEVEDGATVLVREKDQGVHVFFVRSGTVTAEIGSSTSIGVPQGWLAVPRGVRASVKAVTTSSTESRMKILDGSGVVLSGEYSVILGTNQLVRLFGTKEGDFSFLSPEGNATPITVRAQLVGGLAVYARVAGGIAGTIAAMPAGKRVRLSFEDTEDTGKEPFVWTKFADRKVGEAHVPFDKVCYVNKGRKPGEMKVQDAE